MPYPCPTARLTHLFIWVLILFIDFIGFIIEYFRAAVPAAIILTSLSAPQNVSGGFGYIYVQSLLELIKPTDKYLFNGVESQPDMENHPSIPSHTTYDHPFSTGPLISIDPAKWDEWTGDGTYTSSRKTECYPWRLGVPLTGWDEPHHPELCDC